MFTSIKAAERMKQQRHKWLYTMMVFVFAVGLLIMTSNTWLPHLYLYLDTSKAAHQSDAIVVLDSADFLRAYHAADLYQEGFAPVLVVSEQSEMVQPLTQALRRRQVPADALIFTQPANSTWEEAEYILAMLQEINAESALIITESAHIRRASAVYRHLQNDSALNLTFVASDTPYTAEDWWTSPTGEEMVFSEYAKMVYYLFRYGVWSWW